MEHLIASFVEGRIRLRHALLKDTSLVAQLNEFLQNLDGVTSLESNPRTGSILVHYDANILDIETLEGLLQQADALFGLGQPEAAQASTRCCCLQSAFSSLEKVPNHKQYKRLMGALIPATLAFILLPSLKNSRYHGIAGGLFVALSLGHMWRKRKAL